MTKKHQLIIVCLILVTLFLTAHAAEDRSVKLKLIQEMRSEKRVALIIGNSSYQSSPLKNPVNDARLIAKTLKNNGFDVIVQEDAGQKQMRKSIDEFGQKIRGGGVGLFYYAGHGMQVNGRNYLIPVDASINSENEVEYEAIDAGRILAKMETAGNRVNIVILDACRDNPFARSFRSAQKGLAYSDAPKGSFIVYATAPGSVAADGSGSNGVFTEELVKALQSEGGEIDRVFRQVRASVIDRTNERQVPWTASSLVGEFYFKMPKNGGLSEEGNVIQSPTKDAKTSLDDLEKKARLVESKKQEWASWQSNMKQVFEKAKGVDQSDLSSTDKIDAWQRFLLSFEEKNPFSQEDVNMRSEAKQRISYWEGRKNSQIKRINKNPKEELMNMNETTAVIETEFGNITLKFFPDKAPGHVKNFIDLAKKGFYDGTTFHRVIPGFMIQGGDPNSKNPDKRTHGTGGPGYTIKAEFNEKPHKRGTLSMARAASPDSAGSQFFICVKDSSFLDRQYTVFGEVVSGMEAVDKIVSQPRDQADNPNERIEMKVKIEEK